MLDETEQQTETETETQETETVTTESQETDEVELSDQELLMNSLREQAQTIQQLRSEIGTLSQRQQTIVDEGRKKEEETDPLDDPSIPEYERDRLKKIDELIERRLQKSIAPLRQTADDMRRQQQLENVKAVIANDAQFGGIYAQVKDQADIMLANLTTFDPNIIASNLYALYGAAAAQGRLQTPQVKDEKKVVTNRSVPNTPVKKTATKDAPVKYDITEGERVMMRRHGMSEAEWVAFRDSEGDLSTLMKITKEGIK